MRVGDQTAAEITIDAQQLAAALSLGSSTLHEASGQLGALPSAIHQITRGLPLAGRAVPVCGPPGDNLWIHRAIYLCRPGDVLVVDFGGGYEYGYWGEVLSHAARARGISGVVINGCVRDSELLAGIGVPVFARGVCMRGTTKQVDGHGWVNKTIQIGSANVNAGDVVIGDHDGVVILSAIGLDEILAKARARLEQEGRIIEALKGGARTLDLYHLPE